MHEYYLQLFLSNSLVIKPLTLSRSNIRQQLNLPSNHCKREENWIEEEYPKATFHGVCVTVKAHDPIVALQCSRY